MKEVVDDMFGDYRAFLRHLHGPFWEAVNAYGVPLEERKQQKKVILRLPELSAYPEAPSFCME